MRVNILNQNGSSRSENWETFIAGVEKNSPVYKSIEFEEILTPEQLKELARALGESYDKENANTELGYIKWAPEQEGTAAIEKRLAENNQHHKPYPSDFVHAWLSEAAYNRAGIELVSSQTDALEMINTEQEAYKKRDDKIRYALADWTVKKHWDYTKESGYFSVLYVNDKTHQAVLAVRGSEGTPLDETGKKGDWGTDFEEVIANRVIDSNRGQVGQQVHNLLALEASIKDARTSGYNLSFTGHSLGGWLASLCVFHAHEQGYTTVKSVTFDSPGTRQMMEKLQSNLHHVRINLDALNITTYLAPPNLVNTCNKHIGRVFGVKLAIPVLEDLKRKLHGSKKVVESLNFLSKDIVSSIRGLATAQGHELARIIDQIQNQDVQNKDIVKLMEDWPSFQYEGIATSQGFAKTASMALLGNVFGRLVNNNVGDTTGLSSIGLIMAYLGGELSQEQYVKMQHLALLADKADDHLQEKIKKACTKYMTKGWEKEQAEKLRCYVDAMYSAEVIKSVENAHDETVLDYEKLLNDTQEVISKVCEQCLPKIEIKSDVKEVVMSIVKRCKEESYQQYRAILFATRFIAHYKPCIKVRHILSNDDVCDNMLYNLSLSLSRGDAHRITQVPENILNQLRELAKQYTLKKEDSNWVLDYYTTSGEVLENVHKLDTIRDWMRRLNDVVPSEIISRVIHGTGVLRNEWMPNRIPQSLASDELIGREKEIRAIDEALKQGEQQVVILHGGSGMGKSSVAAKYLWQKKEEGAEVRWLHAGDGKLTSDCIILAADLGLETYGIKLAELRDQVYEKLKAIQNVVFVVDNVDDRSIDFLLDPLKEKAPNLKVVLTVNSAKGKLIKDIEEQYKLPVVEVHAFTHSEAMLYATKHLPHRSDLEVLVERVKTVPLELRNAVATLEYNKVLTLSKYLNELSDNINSTTFYPATHMLINKLNGKPRVMMDFLVYCDPDVIPMELIDKVDIISHASTMIKSIAKGDRKLDDAEELAVTSVKSKGIDRLLQMSLIDRGMNESYRMHREVRDEAIRSVANKLGKENQDKILCNWLLALESLQPKDFSYIEFLDKEDALQTVLRDTMFDSPEPELRGIVERKGKSSFKESQVRVFERLLPSMLSIIEHKKLNVSVHTKPSHNVALRKVLANIGLYYQHVRADYAQAIKYFSDALDIKLFFQDYEDICLGYMVERNIVVARHCQEENKEAQNQKYLAMIEVLNKRIAEDLSPSRKPTQDQKSELTLNFGGEEGLSTESKELLHGQLALNKLVRIELNGQQENRDLKDVATNIKLLADVVDFLKPLGNTLRSFQYNCNMFLLAESKRLFQQCEPKHYEVALGFIVAIYRDLTLDSMHQALLAYEKDIGVTTKTFAEGCKNAEILRGLGDAYHMMLVRFGTYDDNGKRAYYADTALGYKARVLECYESDRNATNQDKALACYSMALSLGARGASAEAKDLYKMALDILQRDKEYENSEDGVSLYFDIKLRLLEILQQELNLIADKNAMKQLSNQYQELKNDMHFGKLDAARKSNFYQAWAGHEQQVRVLVNNEQKKFAADQWVKTEQKQFIGLNKQLKLAFPWETQLEIWKTEFRSLSLHAIGLFTNSLSVLCEMAREQKDKEYRNYQEKISNLFISLGLEDAILHNGNLQNGSLGKEYILQASLLKQTLGQSSKYSGYLGQGWQNEKRFSIAKWAMVENVENNDAVECYIENMDKLDELTRHVINQHDLKGHEFFNNKYELQLENKLGELAMLCFRAINLGVLAVTQHNRKPYDCVRRFVSANTALVLQTARQHPEYFVDGTIVEACLQKLAVPESSEVRAAIPYIDGDASSYLGSR